MRAILLMTLVVVMGLAWFSRPAAADDALLQLVEENVALRSQLEELTKSVTELRAELTALQTTVADSRPATRSATLRERIAEYLRAGGVPWYVNGGHTYLIQKHGWSAAQLRGLTQSELDDLHGASHTGQIRSPDSGTQATAAPSGGHMTAKPPAAPAQRQGRWVRRCIDGQCRFVWETDG